MGFPASHMKINGLVEVAVEQIAVPGYRDKRVAHQSFNCTWVKAGCKFEQIVIEIPGTLQPGTKPAQWNIGKGIKIIKSEAPLLIKHLPETFLGLFLRRGKKSTGWVAYQVEFKAGIVLSITKFI
jgi:hypothetical protein